MYLELLTLQQGNESRRRRLPDRGIRLLCPGGVIAFPWLSSADCHIIVGRQHRKEHAAAFRMAEAAAAPASATSDPIKIRRQRCVLRLTHLFNISTSTCGKPLSDCRFVCSPLSCTASISSPLVSLIFDLFFTSLVCTAFTTTGHHYRRLGSAVPQPHFKSIYIIDLVTPWSHNLGL